MRFSHHEHAPDAPRPAPAGSFAVVVAFCHKLGLPGLVDKILPTNMKVSAGTALTVMVADTISGRTPLCRLEETLEDMDLETFFDTPHIPSDFNDDCIGRVLDRIHEHGTTDLFSAIALQLRDREGVASDVLRFDTTSRSVQGDYGNQRADAVQIVHGYSKDHRPDLKQFPFGLVCGGDNVPLLGSVHDGNRADCKSGGEAMRRAAELLRGDPELLSKTIFTCDSASATKENFDLAAMLSLRFITRVPMRYKACAELISEALSGPARPVLERGADGCGAAAEAAGWVATGPLAETSAVLKSKSRPPALYAVLERRIMLEGHDLRAVVVYSYSHDNRQRKAIDKKIAAERERLEKLAGELPRRINHCSADNGAAAARVEKELSKLQYHKVEVIREGKPVYARGRPAADGSRKIADWRYFLRLKVDEDAEAVGRARFEAGCFVLATPIPKPGGSPKSKEEPKPGEFPEAGLELEATDILREYKGQNGVEGLFGFMKDPQVVNAVFLKSNRRVEALGLVILLAVLVASLLQRALRGHIARTGESLLGPGRVRTKLPTPRMLAIRFKTCR